MSSLLRFLIALLGLFFASFLFLLLVAAGAYLLTAPKPIQPAIHGSIEPAELQ